MDKMSLENESDQSSQLDLQNFRQGVAFPFEKLQQIVYNDHKYSATIVGFIRQGLKKIKRDQLEYALILFNQAQKILQYGASCGRIIDRNLIVCVLHNQACCYQKLNQLNKAIKYIEAIIFNLKAHLKSIQVSPTAPNIIESGLLKNITQINRVSLIKKIQLAHYYLQFCSVNSQMKIRKIALQHGKAGIQMFKGFFISLKIQMSSDMISYSSNIDKQKIRNSLKQFKLYRDQLDVQYLPEFIKLGKFYVKKWLSSVKNNPKTIIDKTFKTYSIGNFVQLQSLQYDQQDIKSRNYFTCQQIVRQLLHFSMGYFQVATQYRLIAQQKYKIDINNKLNSQQFKLSNLYHILAIIFIAANIPYNLIFMQQILSSYQHHYKLSLNQSLRQSQIPSTSLLYIPQSKRKTVSKKRKLSELKSLSKKKKMGLTHRKQHSLSKIKNINNPTTAKQQYFAPGIQQRNNLRNQRVNSNQSKNSQKNKKKRSSLIQNKQSNGILTDKRRQRMKTKYTGQGEQKILKKKQRAYQQYCAMPLSIKQRKRSIQKIQSGLKRSKTNSRLSSEQKNQTFRKTSYQKSLNKHLNHKNKNKQKEKYKQKVSNTHKNSTTKKFKNNQNKQKKKQSGPIKNYYL